MTGSVLDSGRRSDVKTATDPSEARGCLLMLGWLYVVGLVVALLVAAGAGVGSNPGGLLTREGLYVVLLAVFFVVGWPLLIVPLLSGHGAPPMSLWARLIVVPLALGWIAIGWWTLIATVRHWIKRRRATGVQ